VGDHGPAIAMRPSIWDDIRALESENVHSSGPLAKRHWALRPTLPLASEAFMRGDLGLERVCTEPGDNFNLVEIHEVPDLSIGDPPPAPWPLDVAHRRRHNGCDRRHVKQLGHLNGPAVAWETRLGRRSGGRGAVMIRARRRHGGVWRGCLVASCVLLLSSVPAGAARTSSTSSVKPADGRLRGQDFAAQVAWPDEALVNGHSVEATTGQRFVVFTLQLAENTAAVSPRGSDPPVTAAVRYGQVVQPISLGAIAHSLGQLVDGSTWPSASQQFTVSVPSTSHTAALVLSQGSFFQAFNLWTLRRIGPAPPVLNRDPERPLLSATVLPSGNLSLSNPADGFSDTAAVTIQSATLGYFPPAGAPGRAIASRRLDLSSPS
jgi:hypothetical protein